MSDAQQNKAPFWDERRLKAAELVVDGKLTDQAIADQVGVSRATIVAWKQDQRFCAKVEEHLAEIGKRVMGRGMARRVNRIREKNARWHRLKYIVAERAAAAEMAGVPGGKSGLIVKTNVKSVREVDAAGNTVVTVHHFHALDTGMLAAFLALEQAIAIECGQWCEKPEAAAAEAPKFMDLTKLTNEQLDQLGAILAATHGHDDAGRAGEAAAPSGVNHQEGGVCPCAGCTRAPVGAQE